MFETTLLLAAGPSLDLIFIGLIVLVAYFFLIRPQAKKARLQQDFIEALDKGDQIVTAGGIHGKITKVDETTVTILVDTKTYLTIEKSTISVEMSHAKISKETASAK